MVREVKVNWDGGHRWDLPGVRRGFTETDEVPLREIPPDDRTGPDHPDRNRTGRTQRRTRKQDGPKFECWETKPRGRTPKPPSEKLPEKSSEKQPKTPTKTSKKRS